jgi:hypothetical protein
MIFQSQIHTHMKTLKTLAASILCSIPILCSAAPADWGGSFAVWARTNTIATNDYVYLMCTNPPVTYAAPLAELLTWILTNNATTATDSTRAAQAAHATNADYATITSSVTNKLFLTNQLIQATGMTVTNYNGSNTVAGIVTIACGYGTVSITNNLVTTNTPIVATLQTAGVATGITATATANLITLTVAHGPATNCLIGWHIIR